MFTPVNGPLELLQMSGNVTQTEQGEPFLHAHVTISLGRPEATCYGGHLVEGCTVFTTCELMIAELENIALMRLMDKHTRAGELVRGIPGRQAAGSGEKGDRPDERRAQDPRGQSENPRGG